MPVPTPSGDLHESLTGHLAWLRGLAGHLVRDDDEADDLVQDTMVAALRRPPALDRPLRPWLAGVLRRLHLERRRKGARRERRERSLARPDATPGTDELLQRLEMGQQLIAAVRDLPEPYRTAVALRYREGLEPRDIARRLGVPGGTIRWRLSEGLARMRARLDEEHGSRRAWVAMLVPLFEPASPPLPAPIQPATWAAPWGIAGAALLAAVAAVSWHLGRPDGEPEAGGASAPAVAVDRGTAEPEQLQGGASTQGAGRRTPVAQSARSNPSSPTAQVESGTPPEVGPSRVVGRVLLPTGMPARGAAVIVIPAEPYALAAQSPSYAGRATLGRAVTDGRGEFEIAGLPEELVQLVARDELGHRCISPPVRARAEVRDGLVLRLMVPSLPAFETEASAPEQWLEDTCSGVLRWSGAAPAPGLRVRVRRAFGPSTVALSNGFRVFWREAEEPPVPVDPGGRFTLPARFDAGEGQVGVEVLLDDGRSLGVHPVDAARLGTDLEIPVGPTVTLTLEVNLDPLETLPPRFVAISAGDGVVHSAAIGSGEPVRFAGLAAGSYELRWFRDDPEREAVASQGTMAFLGVRAGERPVAFTLAPGVERTAFLDRRTLPLLRANFSIDGEPSSRWNVLVSPPDSSNGTPEPPLFSLPLEPPGTLHVRLNRAGVHELRISPSNGAEAPLYHREVTVAESGAQVDADVRTCSVSGTWAGDSPSDPLWLRTSLPDGGHWVAPLELLDGGAFLAERAAPGDADVVSAPSAAHAIGAEALTSIHVPVGGIERQRLP